MRHKHKLGRWFAKVKSEMNMDPLGYLFLAIAVCVLAVIIVYNWQHFYQLIDDDIAGEHLFSKKVWDTGNPFTPTYANNNELLFSRTWLLFIGIYAFVKNVALSTKIELIISILLVTGSAVLFFRKLKWSWSTVFLAVAAFWGLMSIGNSTASVSYWLFPFNVYTMFYIGIFLTLGLLTDIAGSGTTKKDTLKLVFLYCLAIYFGLCGVRMLLYLYIPLEVAMLLIWASKKLGGKSLSDAKRREMIHSSMLLTVNLLAIAVYVVVLIPYMHNMQVGFNLASYGTISENIRNTFMWLLKGIGIDFDGASIMTLKSILSIYRIGLVGALIWIGFFLRKADGYGEQERDALAFLLLSAGMLMFCFIATSISVGGFPGRYVEVPMIVSFMVGISYKFLHSRVDLKSLTLLFCMFIVGGIGLNVSISFPQGSSSTVEPSKLMQLTEYLEETGRTRIAGHYWNISTPVFLSNCEIEGMTLEENNALQPYDWITDRTKYVNDDEPITLILTGDQKSTWEQSEKRSYLLGSADGTAEVAGYYLYDYNENPFAFNLTNYGLDMRLNYITLLYDGGVELDDGDIILHQGDMQFGPYFPLSVGTYDIVVRGENLQMGTFDVVSDSGVNSYVMEDMKVSANQVTYTVRLDRDVADIEFRCKNDSDGTVKIKDIMVTPRDMKPIWE